VEHAESMSARAAVCSADRCAACAALAAARLYGQARRRDAASMPRYATTSSCVRTRPAMD
jgi:hypothetical protein